MNQNIGISFTVKGQDEVTAAVKSIKESLSGLGSDLKKISESLNLGKDFGAQVKELGKFASNIKKMSGEVTGIENLAKAIATLSEATQLLVKAQAGVRRFSDLTGPAPSAAAMNRGGATTTSVGAAPSQRGGAGPVATENSKPNSTYVPNWILSSGYNYPSTNVRSRPNWNYGNPRNMNFYRSRASDQLALPQGEPDPIEMKKGQNGAYYSDHDTRAGYGRRKPITNKILGPDDFRYVGKVDEFGNPAGNYSGRSSSPLSKGGGRAQASRGMSGIGFWLRYNLAELAASEMASEFKGQTLGEDYAPIATSMRDLVATDFSKEQRAKTWASANAFSRQYPLFNSEQYLKGAGQMASSFQPNEWGLDSVLKANEAAMKMSALNKLDPAKAADLLSSYSNAALMQMTPKQQQAAKSNGWLGQNTSQNAAYLNEAIKVFPLWGPDIMNFNAQAMGNMAARGWDVPKQLAFLGTLKSAGFKSSSIGRASKTIMGRDADKVADMMLGTAGPGGGALLPEHLSKDKKQGKAEFAKLKGELAQRYMQALDNDMPEAIKMLTGAMLLAKDQGIYDPLQEFKFSREFIGTTKTMGMPGYLSMFEENEKKIRNANPEEAGNKLKGEREDLTTPWQELNKALTENQQILAKLNTDWPVTNALLGALGQMTEAAHRANQSGLTREGFSKQYPRGQAITDIDSYNRDRRIVAQELLNQGHGYDYVKQWIEYTDPSKQSAPVQERHKPGFNNTQWGIPKNQDGSDVGHLRPVVDWLTGAPLVDKYRVDEQGNPLKSPKDSVNDFLGKTSGEEEPTKLPSTKLDLGAFAANLKTGESSVKMFSDALQTATSAIRMFGAGAQNRFNSNSKLDSR